MKIFVTGTAGFNGIDPVMPFAETGCMCVQRRTRSVVATSTTAADHPASSGCLTGQVPTGTDQVLRREQTLQRAHRPQLLPPLSDTHHSEARSVSPERDDTPATAPSQTCATDSGTYPLERAANPGVCDVVSGILRGVSGGGGPTSAPIHHPCSNPRYPPVTLSKKCHYRT